MMNNYGHRQLGNSARITDTFEDEQQEKDKESRGILCYSSVSWEQNGAITCKSDGHTAKQTCSLWEHKPT